MSLQVYVRAQDEIATEVFDAVEDVSKNRWTDGRVYRGINSALALWGNKVLVPYLYTIAGGLVSGTYEYAIPDYMDGPIEVQAGWPNWSHDGEQRPWDRVAYSIDPTATGGRVLRLHYNVAPSAARITWWGRNGPIPTLADLPVTAADLAFDDTNLTLTTKPIIGRSGFIKVGSEWMSYAGVNEGTTQLVLLNLQRQLFSSSWPAGGTPHTSGATVKWGVAVHDLRLYQQLICETIAYLHALYLNKAIGDQRERHRDQMLYYKQVAVDLKRAIPQSRDPEFEWGREMVGPMIGETSFRYVAV